MQRQVGDAVVGTLGVATGAASGGATGPASGLAGTPLLRWLDQLPAGLYSHVTCSGGQTAFVHGLVAAIGSKQGESAPRSY